MFNLSLNRLQKYLSQLYGYSTKVISVRDFNRKEHDMKSFGYGKPILIEFKTGRSLRKVVLSTLKGDTFGHDFSYDRARNILLAHLTYNRLPDHVRSLDVGVVCKEGSLISLGNFDEFFVLTEVAEGTEYYKDLDRIMKDDVIEELDYKRCLALSNYLAKIHRKKLKRPDYYIRRIRELIGDGECVMGLIDNYPKDFDLISKEVFKEIEKKCLEWRWRLKDKVERLSQVHGDFHPWNILFREGTDFTVLDRSRGEWGEPSDDVASLTINYLFYSLQAYGKLAGPFEKLFISFIEHYIERTGDEKMAEVIQPFYAWRGLVVASPIWYPHLSTEIRKKIFNFICNILDAEFVDFRNINSYL